MHKYEAIKFSGDEVGNLSAGIDAQNDELKQFKAFAREILNLECPGFQRWQKESIAKKHGIDVESVKAQA